MTMERMPDDTRRLRQMIDALRQFLGLGPLYQLEATPSCSWLTEVTDSYRACKSGQVPRKGSRT